MVQVFEGMEIPADCIVLEAAEMTADESAMTGETDPVKKNLLSHCIERRNQIIEEGGRVYLYQIYLFIFLEYSLET